MRQKKVIHEPTPQFIVLFFKAAHKFYFGIPFVDFLMATLTNTISDTALNFLFPTI